MFQELGIVGNVVTFIYIKHICYWGRLGAESGLRWGPGPGCGFPSGGFFSLFLWEQLLDSDQVQGRLQDRSARLDQVQIRCLQVKSKDTNHPLQNVKYSIPRVDPRLKQDLLLFSFSCFSFELKLKYLVSILLFGVVLLEEEEEEEEGLWYAAFIHLRLTAARYQPPSVFALFLCRVYSAHTSSVLSCAVLSVLSCAVLSLGLFSSKLVFISRWRRLGVTCELPIIFLIFRFFKFWTMSKISALIMSIKTLKTQKGVVLSPVQRTAELCAAGRTLLIYANEPCA